MDDVSKLGSLWVGQLTAEVAHRRNRAAESLLTINPEGEFAKQHLMLIATANAMLAAPQLVAALHKISEGAKACDTNDGEAWAQELYEAGRIARAALAAAGAA